MTQICFVCQRETGTGEPFRRFQRGAREIAVHEECLKLLADVLRTALQGVSTEVTELAKGPIRSRVMELVNRDQDNLFTIASERVYKLAAREAVAMVLYVESRPLSIEELAVFLKRCYREIPPGSLRVYLTARNPTTSIRLYLSRTDEGYQLNPQGIRWFESTIVPKLLGEESKSPG